MSSDEDTFRNLGVAAGTAGSQAPRERVPRVEAWMVAESSKAMPNRVRYLTGASLPHKALLREHVVGDARASRAFISTECFNTWIPHLEFLSQLFLEQRILVPWSSYYPIFE